jgi:hypothetical protein
VLDFPIHFLPYLRIHADARGPLKTPSEGSGRPKATTCHPLVPIRGEFVVTIQQEEFPMNKHKQFHFIAVLLLALALSLALAPVCHAQLDGSSGSDELDVGEDSDTGQTDTGSGQADTGSPATATGSTTTGLTVFQAAGLGEPVPPATDPSIQSTVDAFRAALGEPNNGSSPGPLPVGRREINWDGGGPPVADTTAPVTPFDVFLQTRGARFITPGTGLSQAPPEGGPQGGLAALFNNPTYGTIFSTFSPLRLFTPVGSNITEALFFIPGSNGGTQALVRGFGAVFTDVDNQNLRRRTIIEYYDANNKLLFRGIVPASPGDASLSFFGVVFDDPIIARVRIRTGNSAPGPDDGQRDIVMMDDFIYGEPQAP